MMHRKRVSTSSIVTGTLIRLWYTWSLKLPSSGRSEQVASSRPHITDVIVWPHENCLITLRILRCGTRRVWHKSPHENCRGQYTFLAAGLPLNFGVETRGKVLKLQEKTLSFGVGKFTSYMTNSRTHAFPDQYNTARFRRM